MKKDYMSRLAGWARWYLPYWEAEDVLEDYEVIIGTPPRPEAELLREVGRPRDVINALAGKKAYRRWLVVFTVLAACILLPGLSLLVLGEPWETLFTRFCLTTSLGVIGIPGLILAVLGFAASLLFFRIEGLKRAPLSKALVAWLALPAVWAAGVLLLFAAIARDPLCIDVYVWPFLRAFLSCGRAPLAALGVYGLVKARVSDRRWAALYVLALTAVYLTAQMLAFMFLLFDPAAIGPHVYQLSLILAVGAAGTGVALC